MKYFALVFLFISSISFGQTEKKVCFLGNSYTNSNDLPNLIANLATADGNTLVEDSNTPGGYTLEAHTTNTSSLTKIVANEWDYVVLQEQSQRPSFPWEQVNEEVFPFAEILCDSIRAANACAVPLFFNTWGRRDGDDQWDSINTFTKMNQRLHNAYAYMADQNSGKLSPVGIGFSRVANDDSAPIDFTTLYTGDGSHPSIFGSYLAACCFYEIIFEVNSEGNPSIPDGISTEEALYLQEVAHHVVSAVDSITIDYTQPEANYVVSYDGLTATFTNTSAHAFNFYWAFGDGGTSTEKNPVHTYPDAGPYEATLTAIYCDKEDEITGGTDVSTLDEIISASFYLYPNPSENGLVNIYTTNQKNTVFIYSSDGRLVEKRIITQQATIRLDPGLYLIRMGHQTKKLIVK